MTAPIWGSQGEIEVYHIADAVILREKGSEKVYKLEVLSNVEADVRIVELQVLAKQIRELTPDEKRELFERIKKEVSVLETGTLSGETGILPSTQNVSDNLKSLGVLGKREGSGTLFAVKEVVASLFLPNPSRVTRPRALSPASPPKTHLEPKKEHGKIEEIPQKVSKLTEKLSNLEERLSKSQETLKVWTEILEIEQHIQSLEEECIHLQSKQASPREMDKIQEALKASKEALKIKQVEKNILHLKEEKGRLDPVKNTFELADIENALTLSLNLLETLKQPEPPKKTI